MKTGFNMSNRISRITSLLILLFPISGCSQTSPRNNEQNLSNNTIHLHTETWENGKRKTIDTTITMGPGMNNFQFSDSLMNMDPFQGFSKDFPGGGFNFDFNFPNDSIFSQPFNFGFPDDMMKIFEDQQKLLQDQMKRMPYSVPPPTQKKKGQYDERIIDL